MYKCLKICISYLYKFKNLMIFEKDPCVLKKRHNYFLCNYLPKR